MSPALEGRPIVDKSTMHFGVAHINETFASMTAAGMMSADDVAQVIYNATTEGTDQLHYLIGDDKRGFIKAKQEMSDQSYIKFMRLQFL